MIKKLGQLFNDFLWIHLRNLKHGIIGLYFDKKYNIETRKKVAASELGFKEGTQYPYVPIDWFSLPSILSKIELSGEEYFIDIGSGKGRALIQASKFKFQKIIGVEISKRLIELAQRNIYHYLNKEKVECYDFELVNVDASEYEFPHAPLVIFMASPFVGETFDKFLLNLKSSVSKYPRQIILVYQTPVMEDKLQGEFIEERVDLIPNKYRGVYRAYQLVV